MRIVRGRVRIAKRERERERERENIEKYEKGPKIERKIKEIYSPLTIYGLFSL